MTHTQTIIRIDFEGDLLADFEVVLLNVFGIQKTHLLL